jgi:hypothetical protein
MITAGLILLAVGAADLVRGFVSPARRWIGYAAGAVLLLVLAGLSDALIAALVALLLAAVWVWLSPSGGRARASFWPAVLLGVLCAILVASFPPRAGAGILAAAWSLATPWGEVTIDHALLAIGVVVFLMESANVVVRTALQQEDVPLAAVSADSVVSADYSPHPEEPSPPHEGEGDAEAAAPGDASGSAPLTPGGDVDVPPALKGGRLIGPLERLLVFALTLASMYALLAAVLAAKGIVRFPEISRDSAAGNRAEYFLIGSLVSWVIALAGALLVWWAFATSFP